MTDGLLAARLANLKPFAPGENNIRGPDRLPRAVKLMSRIVLASLMMDDQKALKKLLQRLQRMPDVKSDFAFIRYLEFLRSLLEPPDKNGHAPERPPLAQIIVNGKPVMPAPESEPKDPGPDYEEGRQAFTGVDVP